MKTIDTLVEDILYLLENGLDEAQEERFLEFETGLSNTVKRQLSKDYKGGTLRMSNIGTPCARKLWYSVNEDKNPLKETLTGTTRLKFMYGDVTEELILLLAELAGHRVEARQDTQEISGIKGHMDAIIDGVVVDVKSTSSFSFKKFKDHRLLEDDPFGYFTQIMSYLYSSKDDDRVLVKDKAAFLAFDKQLGYMCLDTYDAPDWIDSFPEMYERRKEMVAASEPPARTFSPVPDGKSGNMKLDTFCSYCDFKALCYPGLRTFLYSTGPRFLTTVVKEPDVFEVS